MDAETTVMDRNNKYVGTHRNIISSLMTAFPFVLKVRMEQ